MTNAVAFPWAEKGQIEEEEEETEEQHRPLYIDSRYETKGSNDHITAKDSRCVQGK